MRIAFLGPFGQGNLGNEATLQAILARTRRRFPDAELLCVCTDPADVRARHGLAAVPMTRRAAAGPAPGAVRRVLRMLPAHLRDWRDAFAAMDGVDLLVVPGTGFLTDAQCTPFGWPYDVLRWSVAARARGARVVFASVGAGPIYHASSRRFIHGALALAAYRSYRDAATRDLLAREGFHRAGDRVVPDLAWSLVPPAPRRAAAGPRRVGIGLMNAPGRLSAADPDPASHRAYVETLVAFARAVLARGDGVRLLVGDGTYDADVLAEVAARLRPDAPAGALEAGPAATVDELLAQIADTDVVVATRFHNVVLALLCGRPVVAVSFHHKTASLMDELGLAAYTQELAHLDLERLLEQVRALARDGDGARSDVLRARLDRYVRELDDQYERIFGPHERPAVATARAS